MSMLCKAMSDRFVVGLCRWTERTLPACCRAPASRAMESTFCAAFCERWQSSVLSWSDYSCSVQAWQRI